MSERVKTMLAVASLGLFLLAAVACVRSFLPPTLRFHSDTGKLLAVGALTPERAFAASAEEVTGGEEELIRRMQSSPHVERRFLGFGYLSGTVRLRYQSSVPYRVVAVPYWFILAASGAFPLAWWVNRRRVAARRRSGQCPRCGYDLRETPARCPECGWTSAPPAAATA